MSSTKTFWRFIFINQSEVPTSSCLSVTFYICNGILTFFKNNKKHTTLPVTFKARLHIINFQRTFLFLYEVPVFNVKIIWMKLLPRLTFVQIIALINDRNVPKSGKINLIFEITESLH